MFKLPWRRAADSLHCHWLWHGATVLCDGTVTCGLDDPFKMRSYGNLNTATLRDIFASDAIARRRKSLGSGIKCAGCSLHQPAAGKDPTVLEPSYPYPKRLTIEPSIKCNIRCQNETCNIANDVGISLRQVNFMDWGLYCRLIDEISPHLQELYFYNYGEPFLHPRALDMLAYAKHVNPQVRVTTSTNGILLARDGKAERIAADGLVDFITFTIGGVDQDTYARYHKAGSFEKAMLGMRRLLDEKRRLGVARPIVHWRYLLFSWNDSDECISEALRLREETGVDEFRFMLTASPMEGRSLRRAPGTPGFEAIRPWLAYQDGYSADPFAEAGLWSLEYSRQNAPYSWTGARARIVVTVRRCRIHLFLAKGGTRASPLPRVTIRLPWGEVTGQVGEQRWQDNEILVPKEHCTNTVLVELEIEKLFVPMRYGVPGDSRELGVMLRLTDVKPEPNPYRVAPLPMERIYGERCGV